MRTGNTAHRADEESLAQKPLAEQPHDHGKLLDSIYSLQRHFYDLTRKYFLFGRDRVIARIAQESPSSVIEVGCGTGRNLFLLEKRLSGVSLFGLDASQEMLKQAGKNKPAGSDTLFQFGYAESFDSSSLFGQEKFSCIFFSYSLSMMPDWSGAIDHALSLLEEDGTLWIVDFWDQAEYPRWFQRMLQKWLELFHVRFEPELLKKLHALESEGKITLSLEPIGRRYGYLAKITL